MKVKTIFLLFIIISIGSTSGQVELKNKKLQERLVRIDDEINTGNYEKAIKLSICKDTIILVKNVKKKELPHYMKNDSIIKSKIVLFDENNSKVLSLKSAYDSKEYEVAFQILDLKLNNQNSYQKTQDIQNQLKGELLVVKMLYENLIPLIY